MGGHGSRRCQLRNHYALFESQVAFTLSFTLSFKLPFTLAFNPAFNLALILRRPPPAA